MRNLFILCASLVLFLVCNVEGGIRVAIQKGLCMQGTSDDLLAQLNNSTYYSFQAQLVDDTDIDTITKIQQNFDVVMIAQSGWELSMNKMSPQAAQAVNEFVEYGGGLILSAFLQTETTLTGLVKALDPVSPVNFQQGSSGFCNRNANTLIRVTNYTHPIMRGIYNDFYTTVTCFWSAGGVKTNETATLGEITGTRCSGTLNSEAAAQGIITMNRGAGRVVSFCWPFCGSDVFYNTGSLRFGHENQIFQNAVFWASGE